MLEKNQHTIFLIYKIEITKNDHIGLLFSTNTLLVIKSNQSAK